MTATPIPRTLALTLYGDLDLSVLDELPPGPHADRHAQNHRRPLAQSVGLCAQAGCGGHQAYVVYPVIAESEETELKAAIKMYRELSGKIFADLKVGLLHGRLDADLKDQVMRMFQKGELQILVATTVIEVGVDVPNATVMVIEHAERFRPGAASPVARAHRARSCKILLHIDDRRQSDRRRRAPPRRHGAHQ
jgi:ATP-dependent DNA helicase RecG